MNFSVVREHRNFFKLHHWIECEGVLTPAEVSRLKAGIDEALTLRRGDRRLSAEEMTAEEKFRLGRDVWRNAPSGKKTVLGKALAGVASELIEQKPLRFGYDMLFPSIGTSRVKSGSYAELLARTPTLAEMSCIQGVLCGAMLCIDGPADSSEETPASSLFSSVPGNGVYFTPDWPLPLHEIYGRQGFTYLLLVYTKANAVYLLQEGDPHLHAFKQLGYNFGDRLNDLHNPVVYT